MSIADFEVKVFLKEKHINPILLTRYFFLHFSESQQICIYERLKVHYFPAGFVFTWAPRSYRKYILQVTQPSQYIYANLQYRFAVTSGSPSISQNIEI